MHGTRITEENPWPLAGLLLAGAGLLGLFAYLGQREYLLNPVGVFLFVYAALWAYWVYAGIRLLPRLTERQQRAALPAVLILAVLFRLAVVAAPPSLSTDMYRYVWDGRLVVHHLNPYHYAPFATALKPLRDPLWDVMEYKFYNTIYMPVSQGVFALGNLLFGNDLTGYKFLYVAFDCGVIGLLLSILKALGRPARWILWYAWCPLPVTEVALAGHQDIVGVFLLVLTLRLVLDPRTRTLAGAALAAAALTKGFALLLLPLFCRTYGKRFTLTAGVTLLVLSIPLLRYAHCFLHGMSQYLNNVTVNSGLFHFLDALLKPLTHAHFKIVSKISDLVILGVTLWAARTPAASPLDLLRRAFLVLAITLLVVPTLFPWYLTWVLPFLPLLGRRPSWAFVLLTGLVGLLYTYYLHVLTLWWIPIAEYVPFYAVLWWEYRTWLASQSVPAPAPLAKTTPVGV